MPYRTLQQEVMEGLRLKARGLVADVEWLAAILARSSKNGAEAVSMLHELRTHLRRGPFARRRERAEILKRLETLISQLQRGA